MIYITGDCHADFRRFSIKNFPEQREMTKDDYIIICGDIGGVWNRFEESPEETNKLDWLDERPFTTLLFFKYSGSYWWWKIHDGRSHKISRRYQTKR